MVNGLSPRIRGNRAYRPPELVNRRSIPAYTGEPVSGRGVNDRQKVYPRVYGGTAVDGGV